MKPIVHSPDEFFLRFPATETQAEALLSKNDRNYNAFLWEAALHPALRTLADEARETGVRIFAYIGGLAVIAVIAAEVVTTRPVSAAREPAGATAWVEVNRTFASFALPMPELSETEADYAIRRHVGGGGRKDILSLGQPDGGAADLTIEIYRPGGELVASGGPFDEITARAATIGPAESMRGAGTLPSKFGPFALVDFTARRNGWIRHCLWFGRKFQNPRLQISGWYCQPGPEVVERRLPACALDRLTLLAGGSDPRLGAFFAQAELKRDFCGQKSTYLSPTVRRADWLTAGSTPKLRGHIRGR